MLPAETGGTGGIVVEIVAGAVEDREAAVVDVAGAADVMVGAAVDGMAEVMADTVEAGTRTSLTSFPRMHADLAD